MSINCTVVARHKNQTWEIMEVAEINLLGGKSVSVALSGLSQKELLYLAEAASCTVRL